MIGASAALSVSDIPFNGPVGAVEVGLINGEFLINPTVKQLEESELRLTVAGTKDAILMVEAGANQVSEDVMVDAIMKGHEIIRDIVAFQEDIVSVIGKPKMAPVLFTASKDVIARVDELATPKLQGSHKNQG